MRNQSRRRDDALCPRLARLGALGLTGVAVIHLLDGPGSLSDQFYVGTLELALAGACLPLAVMLLARPVRGLWEAILALNLVAMLVFVASRTVGLPGSSDDIGNWSQLLGLLNLLSEAAVVTVCLAALSSRAPLRRHA